MGNSCNSGRVIAKSKFSHAYQRQAKLGSGEFSEVYLCKRRKDRQLFAMKVIDTRGYGDRELAALEHEIGILQRLRHPHIVEMVDLVHTPKRTKMVLELCDRDLMTQLNQNGALGEAEAAKMVFSLSTALSYLHRHGVVHRDLKPQNVLLTKRNGIKISDFGMSHFEDVCHSASSTGKHRMRTRCGTPYYVAPEVIVGFDYDEKVDFWSLGVILYLMLSLRQPFECGDNLPAMYRRIVVADFQFGDAFDGVSCAARELIAKLLNVDHKLRFGGEEIVAHRWVQGLVDCESESMALDRVLEFQDEPTLQRQSSLGRLVIDDYIIEQ